MLEKSFTTEELQKAKLPGTDTGITVKNSFCDICSPGPNCGTACYIKDGRIIKVEGIDGHPAGNGVLCVKGLAAREYIYRPDRLKTPLKRTGEKGSGKFAPITWDEAFDEITSRLKELRSTYGASSVAFYSGYNKWYRPYLERLAHCFGSVNYGSESSTCFNATAMSWLLATGHDVCNPDIKNAGTFLGWGYNPYYSRNLGPAPAGGRKKSAKVIIVDPRVTLAVEKEGGLHLQPRPGTDGALAHAIARELIVNDLIDKPYIEKNVYGFEPYKEYVLQFTPEKAEEITGVPAEKIREAARIIGENKPLAINQSASAYVHHKNGMQNHRAIQALCALTGSFDVNGGMIPNPDALAHTRTGYETHIAEFEQGKYPSGQPKAVGAEKYPLWFDLMKEAQTTDLSRQILSGEPYPVRGMIAHGMNYRMFNADTKLAEALKSLDFYVDIDLYMTDSAKMADIVLPCRSSYEREELKLYGPNAHYTEPAIEPYGESMADDDIIFELARRLDVDDEYLKAGRDACYDFIFKDTAVNLDLLKSDRQHPLKLQGIKKTPVGQNGFKTPTGKFELWSTVIENYPGLDPLPKYYDPLDDASPEEFPLQLVSGGRIANALHSRLHDIPWLRSLRKDPAADINGSDAAELGIAAGDTIKLSTSAGSIIVKANPTSTVLKGCVFMYHGYPEADVNSIIPEGHNDPYSGYPGFRSVRCRIEKV